MKALMVSSNYGFGNKAVDEEVIQTRKRKIGDLRKKMNDLEK
jgi:hypothetical protein